MEENFVRKDILARIKLYKLYPEFNEAMLDYLAYCVEDFAECFEISIEDAVEYLEKYKGFKYYEEFYEVCHTFSFADTVRYLSVVCNKNGGKFVIEE